jgi:reverse gyrase
MFIQSKLSIITSPNQAKQIGHLYGSPEEVVCQIVPTCV